MFLFQLGIFSTSCWFLCVFLLIRQSWGGFRGAMRLDFVVFCVIFSQVYGKNVTDDKYTPVVVKWDFFVIWKVFCFGFLFLLWSRDKESLIWLEVYIFLNFLGVIWGYIGNIFGYFKFLQILTDHQMLCKNLIQFWWNSPNLY